MSEEYEEEYYEEEETTDLPAGVLERIAKHAERLKKPTDEIRTAYLNYIRTVHGCDDWQSEDADLLEDWAEQMVVELRNTGGGGGMAGSVAFVGCFVGVDPARRDRRGGLVKRAKREFTLDPGKAVDNNIAGHYTKSGDTWVLNRAGGTDKTDIPVDEVPPNSFIADGERICLLTKAGKPKAMSMMGRNYYFLGAPEDEFTHDGAIQLWRLDMQGEDADAPVLIGEPCRIQARPPNENAPEGFKDVLSTSLGIRDNIQYTDEFVDAEMRPYLKPFRYWTDTELHGNYTRLEELVEAFEAGSRTFTINGEQGRSGPVVFVKGTVNRLSSEARDTEYDEDKRSYSLSLTSSALQSIHGSSDASEVMCWIGSACNDLTQPFSARGGEDELIDYAEKSTVLVCGRIAVKRKDGKDIPNLKVMGVFADPRRIRRRQTGGDTGRGQFN